MWASPAPITWDAWSHVMKTETKVEQVKIIWAKPLPQCIAELSCEVRIEWLPKAPPFSQRSLQIKEPWGKGSGRNTFPSQLGICYKNHIPWKWCWAPRNTKFTPWPLVLFALESLMLKEQTFLYQSLGSWFLDRSWGVSAHMTYKIKEEVWPYSHT